MERAAALRDAGFKVDSSRLNTSRVIGTIKENPPAAIVIDLDRLPSHGRAVAAALRSSASTRCIPIVFAGGIEEKIAAAREELPDAVFSPWKSAAATIRKALKAQPSTQSKRARIWNAIRVQDSPASSGFRRCFLAR